MRRLAIVLGIAVFASDQLTKWYVKNTYWLHDYPVIDGYFAFDYVQNKGIAFGWFHEFQSPWKPILLSAMAVLAILVVLYYIWSISSGRMITFISLGLLLGGIMGNFVDRLANQYVSDFIKVHWQDQFSWPTFNIADAAITCGVLLMLYETLIPERDRPLESSPSSETHESSHV